MESGASRLLRLLLIRWLIRSLLGLYHACCHLADSDQMTLAHRSRSDAYAPGDVGKRPVVGVVQLQDKTLAIGERLGHGMMFQRLPSGDMAPRYRSAAALPEPY